MHDALRRPRPLRHGDTVAVIAPASPPRDPEPVHAALRQLQDAGFVVESHRTSWGSEGYLAGPDAVRLDEINALFQRDDVRAVFCVRGGYGTLRLLPHLDYEAARAHPTLLIGYSDVTALHLALYRHARLPGIAGPLLAEWPGIDEASEALLWALAGGATPSPLLGPGGETLQPLRRGSAEGILLGGNLSVLTRLIGTPHLPSLDGALLFLEDVGERPYSLDRMLAHLRLAGHLDRLGGVVLGRFTDWEQHDTDRHWRPEDVFREYFGEAPYPVATGLSYGHDAYKAPIPVGVPARLDVTSSEAALHVLAPVVAEASS